jgi:hypothetical protein
VSGVFSEVAPVDAKIDSPSAKLGANRYCGRSNRAVRRAAGSEELRRRFDGGPKIETTKSMVFL